MTVRIAAIIVLSLVALTGGTMSWLNMGDEARRDWFWCELVKWCEAKPPKPYVCTPQQREAGECL